MDERLRFVSDYSTGGFGMSELCRLYEVSRKTGYKWLSRYRAEGPSGLAERSRAPLGNSRSVSAEVRDLLVAFRESHPYWGARKLLKVLGDRHPDVRWPSESGAHGILRRAGQVKGRRPRGRLSDDGVLFEADAPNAVWTADFKGDFRLGNGKRSYPLTILDSYSRYLLSCVSLGSPETAGAWSVFEGAFREYGLPEVIRTDNGTPFAGTGAGRLTRLSVWLLKLGIVLDRIHLASPEENGRHERMHRTLKAEATRPPAWDHSGQDRRFDAFRWSYNEERPHEALGQEFPVHHYEASPRVYDGRHPEVWYPGHWEVRSVRRSGEIKWRGKRYFVSQALAGESVGLFEVKDGIWWVAFLSHPVAVYDARRDRMHPVLSGSAGSSVGFIALGSPDAGSTNGQGRRPCPPHP